MSKKFLLTTAAILLGAFAAPAFAATAVIPVPADAPAGDPVVAKVNGDDIHRSELMRALQALGPQAQQMPPQMLYPQLLNSLIDAKVVSAQGYAEGLQNDKEVKERMKELETQVVASVYVRKTIEPKITDAKIKDYYDSEVVAKFKPEDEVRARHILVPTEDEANAVIKQLKDGTDFAKLAEEKSKDPGSAKNGGDLGYFTKTSMVKPFADAAFSMKVGDISSTPVKTEFGYHVIKVEDKRKSAPPSLAEVKGQITNKLGQQMTDELVKKLEAKAKIERFNPDGTPMKTASSDTDTTKK
jgi:peptidyl-prolyl cis-trans isomerase C